MIFEPVILIQVKTGRFQRNSSFIVLDLTIDIQSRYEDRQWMLVVCEQDQLH